MPQTAESIQNYFVDQMKKAGLYYSSELSEIETSQELLDSVNIELVSRYHILPIGYERDKLVLVTDNDQTFKQRTQLEHELGHKVKLMMATEENLRAALMKFYSITGYRQAAHDKDQEIDIDDITPLKAAINEMLQDAARQGASDIHLLPTLSGFQVCFRIDGHMIDVSHDHAFDETQVGNVTRLIKMMDESHSVDIQRVLMPNEGSFYLHRGNQDIFVRMETLPVGTNGQEKINLRLLPQASRNRTAKKTLDSLGYTHEDLVAMKSALYKNSSGLFLNSGPTGSGKTTALHAQIHYVLDSVHEPLNVIEIAEPIEIYEDEFTQVQVRKAAIEDQNLTAEKILVASLRSDPDIILYNEIRNAIDTTVAMQASNTGHRVFATVHAADCVRTFSRLLDFDISKTTLLSELKLIVSQRLVAKLCPHCSHPHQLTEEEKHLLSEDEIAYVQGHLMERGTPNEIRSCGKCNHGYVGRTAVAEFIELDTELRDALLNQHSFTEIQNVLRKRGFRTMWEKGLDMAVRGQIELDELIHVVGKE